MDRQTDRHDEANSRFSRFKIAPNKGCLVRTLYRFLCLFTDILAKEPVVRPGFLKIGCTATQKLLTVCDKLMNENKGSVRKIENSTEKSVCTKREEVTGERGKLCSKELHNLYILIKY
jgi:hypothetical protein